MNQNRHSKHQKMTAVREAGFCMIDAGMYLDTHPCDGKAMDYFNRYQQMYKEAVCDYEKHCGPLFLTVLIQTMAGPGPMNRGHGKGGAADVDV